MRVYFFFHTSAIESVSIPAPLRRTAALARSPAYVGSPCETRVVEPFAWRHSLFAVRRRVLEGKSSCCFVSAIASARLGARESLLRSALNFVFPFARTGLERQRNIWYMNTCTNGPQRRLRIFMHRGDGRYLFLTIIHISCDLSLVLKPPVLNARDI